MKKKTSRERNALRMKKAEKRKARENRRRFNKSRVTTESENVAQLTEGILNKLGCFGDSVKCLVVRDDQSRLVETNYWGSPAEQKGDYYVSQNADAIRLLVPDSALNTVAEIVPRKHALITYGTDFVTQKRKYVIYFCEESQKPIAITVYSDLVDDINSRAEDVRKDRSIIVYRNGCVEVTRMPAYVLNDSDPPRFSKSVKSTSEVKSKTSFFQHSNLTELGYRDMKDDTAYWQSVIRTSGRVATIDDLIHGRITTWLGSDSDHKLYIKISNEVSLRTTIASYSDYELGEWFALMTNAAMVMARGFAGEQGKDFWEVFNKDNPIVLPKAVSTQTIRSIFV